MSSKYLFPNPDVNAELNRAFDTSTGHNHDGVSTRAIPYAPVAAGIQGCLASTCTVAVAAIAATDIVLANVIAYATTAYINKIVISAGVGFVAYFSTDTGNATISYGVFKNS